jgi:hypothetical protein
LTAGKNEALRVLAITEHFGWSPVFVSEKVDFYRLADNR